MARRDFTVNAMASRLETGELVDPFGGVARPRAARAAHRLRRRASRDDPLRLAASAALRLASSASTSQPRRSPRCAAAADGLAHVSGERIGGGITADGMGELSKLLLGQRARAGAAARARHRRARRGDPRVRAGDRLRARLATGSRCRSTSTSSPSSRTPPTRARRSPCGSPALLHDLGKPATDGDGHDHAAAGARLAGGDPAAAALPDPRPPTGRRRSSPAHAFHARRAHRRRMPARRFLAAHGDELALRPRRPQARGSRPRSTCAADELERSPALGRLVEAGARAARTGSPTSRSTATTCIAIGFAEGPALGRVAARARSTDVVDEPGRNDRDWLLERAARGAAHERRRRSAAAYERSVREAGAGVTVVAATKYVPLEDMGVARRGRRRGRRREPRAGPATQARASTATRSAGTSSAHLQSNKATRRQRDLRARPRRRHRLDGAPADGPGAARGEPLRRGVEESGSAEDEIEAYRERYPLIRGPDDDAAVRGRPGGSRARRSGGSRARRATHGLARALDGHVAGLARRGRGGRDADPRRQHAVPVQRAAPRRT